METYGATMVIDHVDSHNSCTKFKNGGVRKKHNIRCERIFWKIWPCSAWEFAV